MTELTECTQILMGVLLLVMGLLGFAMCLVEIYDIARQRNIHPFKYFNMSHAVIHGTAQLVVVVVFVSSQLFIGQWMDSSVVGYVALSLQFSSLYTSFIMSLNRAICVIIPTSYSRIFTARNTTLIVIVTWIFSFSTGSVLLIDGCDFYFDGSRAEFAFSDSTCGRFIAKYIDIIYNITLVVIVIPIDILSLFLLHKIAKRRAENTRRLQKEKPFFVQTLLNSVLFAFMLIAFHVAVFFNDIVVRFMMTTAAWEIWLMSPQIIALILLKETRRVYLERICCFKKKHAVSHYEPQPKLKSYCQTEVVFGIESTICYCRDDYFCNHTHTPRSSVGVCLVLVLLLLKAL